MELHALEGRYGVSVGILSDDCVIKGLDVWWRLDHVFTERTPTHMRARALARERERGREGGKEGGRDTDRQTERQTDRQTVDT